MKKAIYIHVCDFCGEPGEKETFAENKAMFGLDQFGEFDGRDVCESCACDRVYPCECGRIVRFEDTAFLLCRDCWAEAILGA